MEFLCTIFLLSAPSVGPSDIDAESLSSTIIQVTWGNVITQHQNGRIIGYKVHFMKCT